MNRAETSASFLLSLIAAILCGCVSNPQPAEDTALSAQQRMDEDSDSAEVLRAEIERALSDPSAREALELTAECQGDAGMRIVRVFGNGIGIWQNRRQFDLTAEDVSSLVALFRDVDFAAMKRVYGGKEVADPGRRDDPAALNGLMVICRVGITAGSSSKEVVQLAKGKKSPELRKLADDLLASCDPLSERGVEASDLKDGLEKVASGDLAGEAMTLMLHRKPHRGAGFLMRVEAGVATTRPFDPASGFGKSVALRLGPGDLGPLGQTLAELDPESLPINLYATDYTDLVIEVLNRKKSIQARQFAGMTPTTHGNRQEDFNRIFEALYALHLRVTDEGTPAPTET